MIGLQQRICVNSGARFKETVEPSYQYSYIATTIYNNRTTNTYRRRCDYVDYFFEFDDLIVNYLFGRLKDGKFTFMKHSFLLVKIKAPEKYSEYSFRYILLPKISI